MRPRLHCRTWTRFGWRDRAAIEAQLIRGSGGICPRCGDPLEARPTTRLSALLPGGVDGFDLDCRACRKFHPRICLSDRSIYLLRLKRLAAAVQRK